MGQRYGGGSSGQYGGAPGGLDNPAAVAITGGNTPYTAFKSGLPLVYVSGGTMGNNGAVSALTTALSRTFTKCYLMLPAGAIAAGVPAAAAWYYAEGSSTTAFTVYNVTFDPTLNLPPAVPTVKTAFSTTGPGAFTGVTAEMTALQYTLAAGAMGVIGQLRQHLSAGSSSSAGAKTIKFKFGGTQTYVVDLANNTAGFLRGTVTNKGETGRQTAEAIAVTGNTNANIVPAELTIDTTAVVAAIITVTKATSTDNVIIEAADFDIAQ